jgi:hypothetical protein
MLSDEIAGVGRELAEMSLVMGKCFAQVAASAEHHIGLWVFSGGVCQKSNHEFQMTHAKI